MFDNLKGMASLAGLMKDLPRLKAKMEEVKTRLGTIEVVAETGGGAVKATANGQMKLVSLRVDRALLSGLVDSSNVEDLEMAEELIVGAVNLAMEKAREAAEVEMREAATELGLPIPPGGIEGMLG
jgi:DNA-binding protein YbaB